MVQRTLAAHSLRHLRFARRVTGGQPPMARADGVATISRSATPSPIASTVASTVASTATYTSPEGRQLPIAPVLRHLPQRAISSEDDTGARNTSLAGTAEAAQSAQLAQAETVLRLLPRLPTIEAPRDAEAGGTDVATDVGPPRPESSTPASDALERPGASERTPSARAGEPRPRSRIIELPGVAGLPTAEGLPNPERATAASTTMTPESKAAQADAAAAPATPFTVASEVAGPPPGGSRENDYPVPEPPSGAPNDADAPPVAETRAAPRRRSSKQTPPSPQREADTLFLPTDADRSAEAWLARLQRSAQPLPAGPEDNPPNESPPDQQPSAPRRRSGQRQSPTGRGNTQTPEAHARPTRVPVPPAEQPAALPDSSRKLLQSLTGVDPADVPIYRGPAAERVAADENADALTDGSAIALGTGHTSDTPETLGLLAHELTHIAHRRSPRFVPPLVGLPVGSQRAPGAAAPQRFSAASSHADEEAQAGHVEATVRAIASRRVHALPSPEAQTPTASQPRTQTVPDQPNALPTSMPSQAPDARSVWGDLPAPWEPLPDWLESAPPPQAASLQPRLPSAAPQSVPPSQRTSPATNSALSPGAADADSGIQRAERGRTLPTVESESPHWREHEERKPEPDLDALAQQIHAILKRRLAAERRRLG